MSSQQIKQAQADIKRFSHHNEPLKWCEAHMLLAQTFIQKANATTGPSPAADKAIKHLEFAIEVLANTASHEKYGGAMSSLGELYQKATAGDRVENLDRALQCKQAALKLLSIERTCPPMAIPHLHRSIGALYANDELINTGEGAVANKDYAVRHFLAALQSYTKDSSPIDWAQCEASVGDAYCRRLSGSAKGNLKVAIKHYNKALEVFDKTSFGPLFGQIHIQMASAHNQHIEKAGADLSVEQMVAELGMHAEKALSHCNTALEVCSKTNNPGLWLDIQKQMSVAYQWRTLGGKSDNIEMCLAHSVNILEALKSMDVPPMQIGTAHFNLADGYDERQVGSRADNLELVVTHFKKALKAFPRMSASWARAHMKLGMAFLDLQKHGDVSENLETAHHHFEMSLQATSEANNLDDWVTVKSNIGLSLFRLPEGNEKKAQDNIRKAIIQYQAVVDNKRAKSFNYNMWSHALCNLGVAYGTGVGAKNDKGKESMEESFEKAIECYTRLNKIWTFEANPRGYVVLQRNMAMAWSNRMKGDKSENMRKSLECYANSLVKEPLTEGDFFVFNQDGFVHDVFDHAVGDDDVAQPNGRNISISTVDAKGDLDEQALQNVVAQIEKGRWLGTKASDPLVWGKEQIDLAETYMQVFGKKNRRENVEKAIGHYKAALEALDKLEHADKWADVQMCLCAAYLQRVAGVRRENMECALRCFDACKEVRAEETLGDDWLKELWAKGAEAKKLEEDGAK